jgi:glycosyltransferase involved in cell wall biosynthesis
MYMSRAALFVLSSAWEGLPGVLIQALACGAPVVSTDCPSGPQEILAGGDYGCLVPVGAVEAMADAMAATLDAPPDRARLAKRGGEFSARRSVDKHLEILLGSRETVVSR